MKKPASPRNETERLRTLQQLCILDTDPDERFDRLTRIAKSVFEVDIVLVSLVDDCRQWFKSVQGTDIRETPRDISFCAHAIHADAPMVIEDTLNDERFFDNPLVTAAPHIRFYAGAPLSIQGYRLGTLCLIDSRPRTLTAQEVSILKDLVKTVEAELGRRTERQLLTEVTASEQKIQQLLNNLPDLIFVLDAQGTILECNAHPELPAEPADLRGHPLADFLPEDIATRAVALISMVLDSATPQSMNYTLRSPNREFHYTASISPFTGETVTAVCRNITEKRGTERRLRSIIEGTNVGTWEWNVQTGETVFNERWAEMVGYTLAELAPISIETWLSLAHPDDLAASEAALNKHFAGEADYYDIECRMRHKDGHWIWVHDRGGLISRDERGAPLWMAGTHADITENRAVRDQLAQQNRFLDTIFNSDVTAITVLDSTGQITYANQQAAAILGIDVTSTSQGARYNDPVWAIESLDGGHFHDEDLPFARVRRTGEAVFNVRHAIVWPDGQRRYLSINGAPLSTSADDKPAFVFAVHDITPEVTAQRNMQFQLEAFKVLNRISANTALTFDEQVRHALRLGTEFLGMEMAVTSRIDGERYTIEHSLEPEGEDLLCGNEYITAQTYCHLALESPDVVAIDHTATSSLSGETCYQLYGKESYIGMQFDTPDGQSGTLCFVSSRPRTPPFTEFHKLFVRLMTRWLASAAEKQRAMREVQSSEYRLRALFDLSPIGIALNDYETGQFIDGNTALLAPTGYTLEEFKALSYFDITPEHYWQTEKEILDTLKRTGRYGPFEKEYIRRDGSRYPILLNGILAEDRDGRQLIWSLIEDISERKRLDRLKNEFISTVSHELRTPLTSIAGALKLLSAGAVGDIGNEARQMLTIATQNSERLTLLINDLLDIEKLMSGNMQVVPVDQPINPLIQTAVESNQAYADGYKVQLRVTSLAGNPSVKVDSGRFIQVMSNLLSNAAKFSPQQSLVDIFTRLTGHSVQIAVRDYGDGIPEDFRPRLFQRFSQADSSDQRSRSGTGLGLSISKALVEQMGGHIDYVSEVGVGTTFWVSLPMTPKIPPTDQAL